VHPVLVELGPLTVYSYGMMVALGFWAGSWIAAREYRRRGGRAEDAWALCLWMLAGAFVVSHGLAVVTRPGGPTWAALLSGAGQVWYGALLGGLATAFLMARRLGIRLPVFLDAVAPGIPIGHALGRIGCHLAGDGDWGTVTDHPWGVAYENAYIGWPHPPGVRVHPTPLYEAAAYVAIFALLWASRRRLEPRPGALLALYLLLAAPTRFAIEGIRVNPEVLWSLTQAQLLSLALFTTAALWLLLSPRPDRSPPP
jgi:phosphatidylglycerol:prolipoprotein diacylglycerol transferase